MSIEQRQDKMTADVMYTVFGHFMEVSDEGKLIT